MCSKKRKEYFLLHSMQCLCPQVVGGIQHRTCLKYSWNLEYLFLFLHNYQPYLLSVHGIVDYWINTGVGHGQPVEGQEHVWCVPGLHDGGVEEGVHKVGVIRQPADGKDKSNSSKHFHNLKKRKCE